MKYPLITSGLAALLWALPGSAQQEPNQGPRPIYNVTVVQRTTPAINYKYRAGPTIIDFRGTVLLPFGKGQAIVDARRGRTQIDAKFEHLTPPQKYGRQFLTYTLWAITPEGGTHNLGEIVPNSSDKAKLLVTTDLQTFGLIVTAEPYATTRTPTPVVVLENQMRPDTVANSEPIQAKYGLLPGGQYTWEVNDESAAPAPGPKVSMAQYEALLEVYEAQNAVWAARAAGAESYAAPTLQKAENLLAEARRLQAAKASSSLVVQNARESAETAEDAKLITERRRQDDKVAAAEAEATRARDAQAQAQTAEQRAEAEASAARAQAQAERQAQEQAQAEAAQAQSTAAQAVAPAPPPAQPDEQKTEVRVRLLDELDAVLPTLDTPRGLLVTVGDVDFNGAELSPVAAAQVGRIAGILATQPGLRVDVEGLSDSAANAATSLGRAEVVERILLQNGLPRENVSARGLADARPIATNSTPNGRSQNRRVEIVIAGAPIGSLAAWDKPYDLGPRTARRQ